MITLQDIIERCGGHNSFCKPEVILLASREVKFSELN